MRVQPAGAQNGLVQTTAVPRCTQHDNGVLAGAQAIHLCGCSGSRGYGEPCARGAVKRIDHHRAGAPVKRQLRRRSAASDPCSAERLAPTASIYEEAVVRCASLDRKEGKEVCPRSQEAAHTARTSGRLERVMQETSRTLQQFWKSVQTAEHGVSQVIVVVVADMAHTHCTPPTSATITFADVIADMIWHSIVFPVPDGPCRRIPRGGRTLMASNRSECSKVSTSSSCARVFVCVSVRAREILKGGV